MYDTQFGNLPLEWIRAFEAAARCGGFAGAANELGLTPSAISQRIGNLEKRLGARLFLRHARRIELTIEAEAWLPHVSAALDNLRESSEALFGVARNQLKLSASESVTQLWIAPRLIHLQDGPDMRISFRTLLVASDISDEDTITFRYGSGDWPDMRKAALFEEVIAPVATPALARQTAPWRVLPRIAVSGPRPGWTEWAARMGGATIPVPTFRFDTFSSGLAAARAGLGVLLGSLPLCQSDLTTGALKVLSNERLVHHETYWMLASPARISRTQWDRLKLAITARSDGGSR